MRKRVQPVQPRLRLRDRRRRAMWMKLSAATLAVILVFVGVFFVSRLSNFQLTDVAVSGAERADAEAVKQLVQEKLSGSYGFLIPHSNSFVAPRGAIADGIAEAFPVVLETKLTQKDPHTLLVMLTERATAAVWCSDTECFDMDKDGFMFAPAADSDGYVVYSGGAEGGIGATLPDFDGLHAFVEDSAQTASRTPKTVSIDANNDVTLAFAEGGELKFVRTEDTEATLENIASVFASQNFKSKSDFEYADFRYGNKVYVKFKGE